MTMTADNSTHPAAGEPKQYGRPLLIEEKANRYVIHPLSDLVVKGAVRLGVTPNMVSVAGLLLGWIAGFFYYKMGEPGAVWAAFLSMFLWHVLDGADGRLARLTGNTSAFGRIIDGLCDHLVFLGVYVGIIYYLVGQGSDAVPIWILALAAGVSHAVQAAGYEERRQKYQRRCRGETRASIQKDLLHIDGKKSFMAAGYDSAQRMVGGTATGFDAHLAALKQTDRVERIGTLTDKSAVIVRCWSLLNANNRTLLIFLMALLGQPVLYFVVELTVMNLLLVGLIVFEHWYEKRLVRMDIELFGALVPGAAADDVSPASNMSTLG